MRRPGHPFGKYLVEGKRVAELGPPLKAFMEKLGFPVVKYKTENEGDGIVVIAVNKKVMELLRRRKPSGHIEILSGTFAGCAPRLGDLDEESQRVGVELYLWPTQRGTLLEIFVFPYMELFNRPEIEGLTETKTEEITDMLLCEHTWEAVEPEIVNFVGARVLKRYG